MKKRQERSEERTAGSENYRAERRMKNDEQIAKSKERRGMKEDKLLKGEDGQAKTEERTYDRTKIEDIKETREE